MDAVVALLLTQIRHCLAHLVDNALHAAAAAAAHPRAVDQLVAEAAIEMAVCACHCGPGVQVPPHTCIARTQTVFRAGGHSSLHKKIHAVRLGSN